MKDNSHKIKNFIKNLEGVQDSEKHGTESPKKLMDGLKS